LWQNDFDDDDDDDDDVTNKNIIVCQWIKAI
jgi:hypothetical protein